jgi:hypothetical protein
MSGNRNHSSTAEFAREPDETFHDILISAVMKLN